MRTRCPHCHQPVEIVDDDPLVEIRCTSCGSTFSLASGHTATASAGQTRMLGQFELLEELGCGAFGTVWKAHDRELDRVVAIKLPRQESISEAEMERFLREARATAQLHHSGIVSIHEIGREGDQIYIVSDFVEGATLADWLDAKPLSHRETAELVAQVADALGHAHLQGIIHRDLKPANILIDGDGRPHLTDFGLAKRDAGEITMTVEGQILGTPAYMSPEQARGEGHRVDKRADIYSLGVILYQLLTGELPFRGSSRMMILQIINDDPPSPRKMQVGIPRDLETITLRCLAKDPERRYATAAELSADLRRWLAGEPIHARPISSAERLGRWCQRNPVVAGLSAAAVLLILAVAGISTAAAIHLGTLAEQERDARDEAELNFRRARNAVDEMLTEVGHESLANVPYLEHVRRALLEKALGFYAELLKTRPSDPALRQEVALARYRVGQINAMLGRTAEAREAYAQSIQMLDALAAEFPDVAEYRHHLAVCHNDLGEFFREAGGDLNKAEEHYRQALDLQLQLLKESDEDADLRELTRTQNNLGILYMHTARPAQAATSLHDAVKSLEQLAARHPERPDYRADLARTWINIGVLDRKQGRLDGSERAYEQAIEVLAGLVEEYPKEREYRFKRAVCELDLANLLVKEAGRPEGAKSRCLHAQELLRKLSESFAAVPKYRLELANTYVTLANIHAGTGDLSAAEAALGEGLTLLDDLGQDVPVMPKSGAYYCSLRGITLGGLSQLALMRDAPEEARELVLEAIEEQNTARKLEPQNEKYSGFLKQHYEFLAQILKQLGEKAESEKVLRMAEQIKLAA